MASCAIIATYGGRDRSLRSAPAQLDAALDTAGIDHEIITYPDAGHGFLNDHTPDETPMWAKLAGHLVVTDYHGPCTVDARRRIVAYLDSHLDPDGPR